MKAALTGLAIGFAIWFVCASICPAFGSQTPSRLPVLVAVDCMPKCVPCNLLKQELKKNRVQTTERDAKHSEEAKYFPTCHYSDGIEDAGERVFSQTCNFKDPVTIVNHKE